MKLVVAALVLTAAAEVAFAYEWPTILNLQDDCSVDDASICSETALWLTDSPFSCQILCN
jgi:hypothetical protein